MNNNKVFDLEDRTANFGKQIISFCQQLPKNVITNPLINQLIRSGTSIGANYMEANGAESKKDFIHKIHLCKKESKETMHWLKMIGHSDRNLQIKKLLQEAKELTLIFSKICLNNK